MSASREGFVRLYRGTAPALLAFFEEQQPAGGSAIDLTADTFALALERWDAAPSANDEALVAWLWDLARDRLDDDARRAGDRPAAAPPTGPAVPDPDLERVEELATREALHRAVSHGMADLPPEQRRAVALRVLEDLSYREVGLRLGVSAARARKHVAQGLRSLEALVRRNDPERR